jgi:uncharacterized repeat protein (TIGR03843 family)
VSAPELIELLERGDMTVKGRMPWSSNATFLVEVCNDNCITLGVYKPSRGERPLWDFPSGLGRREVAAYLLSEALGWQLVPETVWRDEGPLGAGSLQRFVEADFERHYFTLYEEEGEQWHDELRRLCVFDLLANSTDRKSGHCLFVPDSDGGGHIYAIDNGLSFHAEFKLRTVIWEFGGEDIPAHLLHDVERFVAAGIPDDLAALLDPFERDALLARGRAVVNERRFPIDGTGRRYPWPLV